jgi:hypothetical protein
MSQINVLFESGFSISNEYYDNIKNYHFAITQLTIQHQTLEAILQSPVDTFALHTYIHNNAMVRSKLECNTLVWKPHEDKHIFMIEKVSKAFPHTDILMYPTKLLLDILGHKSLELRRKLSNWRVVFQLMKDTCNAAVAHTLYNEIVIPSNSYFCRYTVLDRPD